MFILGTGRCGTTLLYRILATHPGVAVYPSEGNDLWHPRSYPYAQASIDTPPHDTDPGEFTRRSCAAWPSNHDDVVKRTFGGFNLVRGRHKPFVLQSAMISFLLPEIRDIFPDARFVHLVRNGVSVAASLTRKNWKKKFSNKMSEDAYMLCAARYWRDCVTEIHRAAATLGLTDTDFIEIRYETLCDNPKGTLEEICGLLNVDAAEIGFDLRTIESCNNKVGDYVQDERWRTHLNIMGEAMESLGYACNTE